MVIVLGITTLVSFFALWRDELSLSKLHLGDILPHWSAETWWIIGLGLLLALTLEGSYKLSERRKSERRIALNQAIKRHAEVLKNKQETHDAALLKEKNAHKQTLADLEIERSRVSELRAKLGRPHVTLKFVEVDYERSRNQPPVDYDRRTELVATCSGRDAYGVYIDRTQIGSIEKLGSVALHSMFPTERIAVGESDLLPYTLLYYSDKYGEEVVNLEFKGHLVEFFNQVLDETPRVANQLSVPTIYIPFCLKYRDVDGEPWNTPMYLHYIPGMNPMFELASSKQLGQGPCREEEPQSPESTKHEN